MSETLILIAAAAAVIYVNWYFLMAPVAAVHAAPAVNGMQEVTITVEGGYTPSLVRVKQGTAVRLLFDRKEKSPCSDEIVIGGFGIRRFLKAFEKTSIELPSPAPGSYEFTCGMGMLRGRIEVEE